MTEFLGVRCFSERNNTGYYQSLIEAFDLKRMKETAQEVKWIGKELKKLIEIDICGSAGSSFLQPTLENKEQQELYKAVTNLFENLSQLTDQHFTVRIRFLFAYPYSDFSIAKIEAEQSPKRTTITSKKIENDAWDLFSLTSELFFGSDHYIKQKKSLQAIEDLYNSYCLNNTSLDVLNIRFACIPINIKMVSVNKMYFFEPYIYAKQNPYLSQLNKAPSVRVDAEAIGNVAELEDHFRYIWNHPTTLLYQDATSSYFENGRLRNLTKFKAPHEVSFENRIQYEAHFLPEDYREDDNRIDLRKFQIERMFRSVIRTLEVESTSNSEVMFMAFSFKNGKRMAEALKDFIDNDFPRESLQVNLVDLDLAKKPLHDELIQLLDDASLGVIFLTKDLVSNNENSVNYYSRPNIYFEYGYLYSNIKKIGNPIERITIFNDPQVPPASDFQDIGRYIYSDDELTNYYILVERILRVIKTLTLDTAKKVISRVLARYQMLYDKGERFQTMNPKDFLELKSGINGKLANIVLNRLNW